MGRKKELKDCKTARDFQQWGNSQGMEWDTNGRHPGFKVEGRKIPVPCHGSEDLAIGTRRSIIGTLKMLGLAIIVVALGLPCLLAQYAPDVLRGLLAR